MRCTVFFAALSILGAAAVSPVAAETLAIELPWFLSTCTPVGPALQGSLELPANVSAIHGARLVLEGTAGEGVAVCDGAPPVYLPAPVEVLVFVYNPCTLALDAWWLLSLSELTGAVALDLPLVWDGTGFADPPPVDWSCWLGGPVSVEMAWATALVGMCGYDLAPTFSITRAELVLEVTRTVAAQTRSWGGIRAMYD